MTSLQTAVRTVVERHGNLRRTHAITGVSPSYLCRLLSGEKDAPSNATLKALGITVTISYTVLKEKP